MDYLLLKFIHVIGATVLLGTGTGIAFFMLMAHRSRDVAFIARTAELVVIADYLFTASSVIVQPISGYLLIQATGFALTENWVMLSLGLYVVAGVFWLPVVWMQSQMRDLAKAAAASGTACPSSTTDCSASGLCSAFRASAAFSRLSG